MNWKVCKAINNWLFGCCCAARYSWPIYTLAYT